MQQPTCNRKRVFNVDIRLRSGNAKVAKKMLSDSGSLSDLIIDAGSLDNYSTSSISEKRILESYRTCMSSLYINDLISENENISIDQRDILKPDFVLYAPETESIVILEL
jgi:hypothetical protein